MSCVSQCDDDILAVSILNASRHPLYPTALQVARLFWYVMDTAGPDAAAKFLKRLARGTGERVDLRSARIELATALRDDPPPEGFEAKLDNLLATPAAGSEEAARIESVRHYTKRLRATSADNPRGHVFVNGRHLPFDAQLVQQLNQVVQVQMQVLVPLIYYGKVTEESDVAHHFYDLPTTFAYRSELVFPTSAKGTTKGADAPAKARFVNTVNIFDQVNESMLAHSFCYPGEEFLLSKQL